MKQTFAILAAVGIGCLVAAVADDAQTKIWVVDPSGNLVELGKDGSAMLRSVGTKTQALNVNLTAELRRYVKEQA